MLLLLALPFRHYLELLILPLLMVVAELIGLLSPANEYNIKHLLPQNCNQPVIEGFNDTVCVTLEMAGADLSRPVLRGVVLRWLIDDDDDDADDDDDDDDDDW